MAGANYIGGKRNAARARTRDNTGRLQKRHFGQQRLAAALCNTREEREKPRKMTLESALRGIGLAQRDPRVMAGTGIPTAVQKSTSCDPPSTSSTYKASFDISKRRKPHSKILRTLDFSDPTSYRDAINRILSIPLSEMIGLPVRGKSPHAQDEGSDDSHNEPLSIDDDAESDVQVQETSSDVRSSANGSHLSSLGTGQGRLYHPSSERNLQLPSPDQSMDTDHSLLWSVEVDDPQGDFHFVDDSGYADMDATDTKTFRGSILTPDLLGPQRYISPSSNSFQFSFCSTSQGTEECILDMDTSPPSSPGSFVCSIPFESSPAAIFQCDISPDHDPLVQQSQFQSASLLSFSAPINPIKSSSPQLHVSASAPSANLEHMSLSLHPTEVSASRDGPFQCAYPFPSVDPSFPSFGSSDMQDPGLPLDILNDPDPWATIGKILNIETVKEHDNDDVHFPHGREGVGYVRPHLNETIQKKSSKINPPLSVEGGGENELRAMMNDELKKDSGENSGHGHFARYQSQHVEDSQLEERPSLDNSTDSRFVNNTLAEHHKPLFTSTVVEPQMQKGLPSHQASPLIVRRGPNEDKMCEGPCLFVDSGGEDE